MWSNLWWANKSVKINGGGVAFFGNPNQVQKDKFRFYFQNSSSFRHPALRLDFLRLNFQSNQGFNSGTGSYFRHQIVVETIFVCRNRAFLRQMRMIALRWYCYGVYIKYVMYDHPSNVYVGVSGRLILKRMMDSSKEVIKNTVSIVSMMIIHISLLWTRTRKL